MRLLNGLLMSLSCFLAAPIYADVANFQTTFYYQCDNGEALVASRKQSGELWLFLPEKPAILTNTPSASGVKYSNPQNILVWQKGDQALISTEHKNYGQCRNNKATAKWHHAKLNGANFRSLGNEPSWELVISKSQGITLATNLGTQFTQFDYVVPTKTNNQQIYQTGNQQTHSKITVTEQTCYDSMSAEQFTHRVKIEFDQRTLTGCGRALNQ